MRLVITSPHYRKVQSTSVISGIPASRFLPGPHPPVLEAQSIVQDISAFIPHNAIMQISPIFELGTSHGATMCDYISQRSQRLHVSPSTMSPAHFPPSSSRSRCVYLLFSCRCAEHVSLSESYWLNNDSLVQFHTTYAVDGPTD